MKLLLESPYKRIVFRHSIEIPAVRVSLKPETLGDLSFFSPFLEKTAGSWIPAELWRLSHPRVETDSPKLLGSTFRYKWLAFAEENQKSSQFWALKRLRPGSSAPPAGNDAPVLVSGRVRRVLQLLGEGRAKRWKQLVIVDSEAMAVSLASLLRKQGLAVLPLRGDPTNSNPCSFWDHRQCVRFNHASSATIALVCLRRFADVPAESAAESGAEIPAGAQCYAAPMVQQIIVGEKPRPGYWDSLYHNVLFMLGTKRNAAATVKEVFSELETRVSLSERKEKADRKALHDAKRVLFALGTFDFAASTLTCSPKEKKELRPSLCEVWDPTLWTLWEQQAENRDFLWNCNERTARKGVSSVEFPAVGVSSENRARIVELDRLTEFQKQASTAIRLKPLFSAIPLLSYCFAVDAKYPFSPSLRATAVSEDELDALLNPPLLQHHFSFPTYPVIPAENEQIQPFSTRPWRHVASWSLKPSAGSFALDPSSLSLPAGMPAPDVCSYPSLEASLIPAEAGLPGELAARGEFKMESLSGGSGSGGCNRSDLGEYGGVERSLVSWEQSMLREFNANPGYQMDSFLYGTLPVEKNRFTATPERFSMRNALSLSVSVSKSSEMTESTRKRARKRAREGEEEEKEKPESIWNFINQKVRLNTFTWTRKEDELLLTLVSQFGTSWNLICNVFVLENWQRLHPWKQFPENWRFLAERKRLVDAAIPIQIRYTCIPQKTLSTTKNPFFAYCYPYLKDSPAGDDDDDDDDEDYDDHFDNRLETTPKSVAMEEEEAKKPADFASPIDAIFAAVESKQVQSALFKPSTLDETQLADLKKRDAQFAKFETDRLKRLQRYLRPETPASSTKDLARRAPASFRNPSSLASDPSSLNSLQNPDKTMRNRVPVRSFPMQRPADIKKLRENAIRMLPIAQILIKTDSSKFKHLLDSHRRPQDGIVVPYEQALEQGQRILDESTKQHTQLNEIERKPESDIPVKLEPETAALTHTKSQATEVMEGLRDLFDSLPSFSREAQESARNHAATPSHELDDSSPVISFDLKLETGETGETPVLPISPPAPVLVSSIATAATTLSAPAPSPESPETPVKPPEKEQPIRYSRQYPFTALVMELESRSVKRGAAKAELEESVNLKQQKIPRSSLERVRRSKPSIEPYPYCPTDSQHTCNNNRFLQRCLKNQNEQLRNPGFFVSQMSALQRKEGMSGGREMGEVWKRGRREV